jgi:hypothetical protein
LALGEGLKKKQKENTAGQNGDFQGEALEELGPRGTIDLESAANHQAPSPGIREDEDGGKETPRNKSRTNESEYKDLKES